MTSGREARRGDDRPREASQPDRQSPAASPNVADLEAKLTTVLEQVPEPQRQQLSEVVHQAFASVSFQGPMPPPTMLAGYNDVSPGAANRIIAMAEKEQSHRHQWETRALSADRWYSMGSLLAGWSVAVALAVAAAVVGIFGDWKVGVALAATSATGMVWKLIQGRSDEKIEENTKTPASASPKPRGSKSKGR